MNARRHDILSTLPVVEEAEYLRHMTAFVASFVDGRKRDRWLYLLIQRPSRIGRQSHKLHSDLDRRTCRRFENYLELQKMNRVGVYYAFRGQPRWLDIETCFTLALDQTDAILSVVPGRLAVFYFHEYETWLCESA